MSRSRLPALLTSLAVLLLLGAAPAQAQVAVDLVDELRQDGVAVEPGVETPIDEEAVQDAVSSAPVDTYVAVVTQRTASAAGGPDELVQAIGQEIGDTDSAVLVIADQGSGEPYFSADEGQGAFDSGIDAGAAIERALTGAQGGVTEQAVTAVVADFVDELDAGGSSSGTGGTAGGSGGGGGLLALLGLGALGVGGYTLLKSRRTKRSRVQELDDLRADVESLYGRLGSDVQLLAPGDDAVARQALADASERYTATGALLAKADTPGEYAAARRTAVEGLAATRVVRQQLGLDPGPDVPLPPGEGPQLTETARVQVGDDEYEGSPSYEPGRPHYYEGGSYGGQAIPGGWYATPFWQTLLMGSLMSGGRRHGGYGRFGGGYSGGIAGGSFGGMGGGLGGGGLGGVLGGARGGRRRGGGGGWSGGGRRGGGGSWGGGGRRRGGGGGW